MSTGGKVGCLLRLEPNKDAKVSLVLLSSVARSLAVLDALFTVLLFASSAV